LSVDFGQPSVNPKFHFANISTSNSYNKDRSVHYVRAHHVLKTMVHASIVVSGFGQDFAK
jgi:type IV secretory pathway VirD2 relaxase